MQVGTTNLLEDDLSNSIEYARVADNLAQVSRFADQMMDGWMGIIKGLADKCRIMADKMDRIVADVKHDDDTSEAA
jgi:hypothetical protein